MERRLVLGLGLAAGAAAGVASLSTSGCALTGLGGGAVGAGARRPLGELELRAFCRQLDTAMAALQTARPVTHLLPGSRPHDPAWRAAAAEVDALGRTSLRALTFAGMVGSLPPESQQDPAVALRVRRMLPELDEAVFGMTAVLASTSPHERAALQRTLRQDPDATRRLAAFLDAPAKELGVPPDRRLQMGRILEHVSWRIRKQSAAALFDEYVDKVEKVAARSGQREVLRRHLITATTQAALWRSSQIGVFAAGTADGEGRTEPGRATAAPSPLEPERPQATRGPLTRRGKEITAGGLLFGIGLASIGASVGLWLGGGVMAGMVILTPASIIALAGLITLFVGLGRSGPFRASPRPRAK